MAKSNTTMSKFGTTYDINAINTQALKIGVKPLTPKQIKKMSSAEISQYLKAGKRAGAITSKTIKKASKSLRKNASLTASENYKQAKLMHGTIRQGIAEIGAIGAQAVGTSSLNKLLTSGSDAVKQNTDGGTIKMDMGSNLTEKGPVYAYKEREED